MSDCSTNAFKVPDDTIINIIRCRDCSYSRYDAKYCGLHEYFGIGDYEEGLVSVNPDGFCAWAEAVN